MIIFLHGPDSFRSRQKLNAMIDQFKKTRDPRGDNVVRLEGEKLTLDELNSKLASQSLLAEKRMIIVSDLFSHKEKNIFKSLLEYLKKLEKEKNENVVIFYEACELDSKKFGAKKLLVERILPNIASRFENCFRYLCSETSSFLTKSSRCLPIFLIFEL